MKNKLQTISIGLCALALWASMAAQGAVPVITNITMFGATPRFGVHSDMGITNQVQYCTNLSQSNWVVLTNQLVAQSPYWFVDVAAPPRLAAVLPCAGARNQQYPAQRHGHHPRWFVHHGG